MREERLVKKTRRSATFYLDEGLRDPESGKN